jgi:polyribonucleotide nucleotidyltransferase
MSTMTDNLTTVSVTVGDQEMTFESGKLAKQADGSVVVRAGDTMVLATAQGKMEAREGADFFPLTVDVEARMIDRPIRPLWPKGYKNEVHVVCTTLSADLVTAHDILCINGASAALMVSPLPFLGPVGAVRIGRIDGQLVINPTLLAVAEESSLDLIVVGTKDALTMIEAGADEIPEEEILEAFEVAHAEIVKI